MNVIGGDAKGSGERCSLYIGASEEVTFALIWILEIKSCCRAGSSTFWQGKQIQSAFVFISNVLLEHNRPRSCTYGLW